MTKEKMIRLFLNSAQLKLLQLMSVSISIDERDLDNIKAVFSELYDELTETLNKFIL